MKYLFMYATCRHTNFVCRLLFIWYYNGFHGNCVCICQCWHRSMTKWGIYSSPYLYYSFSSTFSHRIFFPFSLVRIIAFVTNLCSCACDMLLSCLGSQSTIFLFAQTILHHTLPLLLLLLGCTLYHRHNDDEYCSNSMIHD